MDLVVALDDLARRRRRAPRCCGSASGRRPRRCRRSSARRARAARSPTTSAHGSSTNGPSVSITSSGHTTRSTGGSTSSVASTWRSNTSIDAGVGLAGALLAAALHEGDLGACRRRGPTGATIDSHDEHDDAERDAAGASASARRTAAATAWPTSTATSTSSRLPPTRSTGGERPGHLADGEVGERHAAEGPASSAAARRASTCRPAPASARGPAARPRCRRRASPE